MALMEYNGYHAKIDYNAEDSIFVGSVIGINDSLNFHGTSVEELADSFKQSVDNYLELCNELGKKPDKEYRGSVNVRLSPQLHRSASIYAADRHISLNQFIAEAVDEKCRRAML